MDAQVGLGLVHMRQRRYEPATDHYEKALELAHATGHRTGEQSALACLGFAELAKGEFDGPPTTIDDCSPSPTGTATATTSSKPGKVWAG